MTGIVFCHSLHDKNLTVQSVGNEEAEAQGSLRHLEQVFDVAFDIRECSLDDFENNASETKPIMAVYQEGRRKRSQNVWHRPRYWLASAHSSSSAH